MSVFELPTYNRDASLQEKVDALYKALTKAEDVLAQKFRTIDETNLTEQFADGLKNNLPAKPIVRFYGDERITEITNTSGLANGTYGASTPYTANLSKMRDYRVLAACAAMYVCDIPQTWAPRTVLLARRYEATRTNPFYYDGGTIELTTEYGYFAHALSVTITARTDGRFSLVCKGGQWNSTLSSPEDARLLALYGIL